MITAAATTQINSAPLFQLLGKALARIEWFRVKNHLKIVEQELRQKNVDHLSSELQHERAKNIARLHDYWKGEVYPINHDFFDTRAPYFRDAHGTLCAMAYLIEQSGHRDLVHTIARTNNNIYIDDIHEGPVMDWVNASGLTKKEAARIQPTYSPDMWNRSSEQIVPGHYSDPNEIFLWIIFAVGFILLEWFSYHVSSWLKLPNWRVVAWVYLAITNLVLAFFIATQLADLF